MGILLIQSYLSEIDRLRKFSGSSTEGVISEAFKDLLKAWSKQNGLIFLSQFEFESPQKTRIRPDGTIVHDLRVPLGYWEAKDTDDDLDREIEKKFKRGYPQDNIVFENSQVAVLVQNRREVLRCDMTDPEALGRLVTLFFGYERPEIAEFRKAVGQFRADLPEVLKALRARIDEAYATNKGFAKAAAAFLDQAKKTINPAIAEADVREMLIQHILTEEIFTQVFNEGDFHRENNIAKALYALEAKFFTGAVKKDTLRAMDAYYAAIKANAAQITSHAEKQTFLKVIYENFYKVYNPKAADRLGVVYTPGEIVRFMIEGADWLCEKHFGRHLIDRDVEILDPATGTGTFICELLEHFRGQPKKLAHKYKEELHANEVAILPYYVANLNIEATYAAISGQYAEYPNLCFVDTLDNVEGLGIRSGHQHDLFGALSEENVERIKRQNRRKISVVIGNPPYNAWQDNFNNRNPNRAYRRIDERIRETYVRKGTAQNKNSVYDMYTRFFRWASDRLHDDGILTFITNRNFIEKAAFDGFRRDLAEEFAEIYVVDLGGDVRANPKLSGTKHNVFGIQTGVTIAFLVKQRKKEGCRIHYVRRPEMDTAEDKLGWLSANRLATLVWQRVEPDDGHNWLNQSDNDWGELMPLVSTGSKKTKALFSLMSNGVQTKRDEWAFDVDRNHLDAKARYLVKTYESSRVDGKFLGRDSIKWDAGLDSHLRRNVPKFFESNSIVQSSFRPFVKKFLYFDKHFNARHFQLNSIFPNGTKNPTISYLCVGSDNELSTLAVQEIFDLGFLKKGNGGTNQGLPRYRYTPDGERIDNITDWGLKQFHSRYGKKQGKRELTKDAIFHYVYGVLHDPLYRETYAQNLKREFPRIPFHADFWLWADWGERLMGLHLGYESVAPWPLQRIDAPDARARKAGLSPRVILKADRDAGVIALDSETQLSGVPPEAWAYRLGNRSALDWILDQHKEKTPKDPTIREKFNAYRFADYKEKVVDLLMRVTRVSAETVAITEAMRTAKR